MHPFFFQVPHLKYISVVISLHYSFWVRTPIPVLKHDTREILPQIPIIHHLIPLPRLEEGAGEAKPTMYKSDPGRRARPYHKEAQRTRKGRRKAEKFPPDQEQDCFVINRVCKSLGADTGTTGVRWKPPPPSLPHPHPLPPNSHKNWPPARAAGRKSGREYFMSWFMAKGDQDGQCVEIRENNPISGGWITINLSLPLSQGDWPPDVPYKQSHTLRTN